MQRQTPKGAEHGETSLNACLFSLCLSPCRGKCCWGNIYDFKTDINCSSQDTDNQKGIRFGEEATALGFAHCAGFCTLVGCDAGGNPCSLCVRSLFRCTSQTRFSCLDLVRPRQAMGTCSETVSEYWWADPWWRQRFRIIDMRWEHHQRDWLKMRDGGHDFFLSCIRTSTRESDDISELPLLAVRASGWDAVIDPSSPNA